MMYSCAPRWRSLKLIENQIWRTKWCIHVLFWVAVSQTDPSKNWFYWFSIGFIRFCWFSIGFIGFTTFLNKPLCKTKGKNNKTNGPGQPGALKFFIFIVLLFFKEFLLFFTVFYCFLKVFQWFQLKQLTVQWKIKLLHLFCYWQLWVGMGGAVLQK